MNEFTEGQLVELCQMVYRGVKPCAMMIIKFKDIQFAQKICANENCKSVEKKIDEEWGEFWIFIRIELIPVIELLPKKPKTALDHYALGAIFGYSNEMICNYLKEKT